MLPCLLATTLVLEPVMGCIAGLKFVPPASLVIEPIKRGSKASKVESPSDCVPCSRGRGGLSGAQSPRFAWPAATTTPPCCPVTTTSTATTTTTTAAATTTTTSNDLTNATGDYN